MTTWTAANVKQIRSHFQLTYGDVDAIESALTDFESEYGTAAIEELQANLTQLDNYQKTLATGFSDKNYGATSLSIDGYGETSRSQGRDGLEGVRSLYDSLRIKVRNELIEAGLHKLKVGVSRVYRG
ncbi:MAG: hypothetical protein AAF810_05360 [Cyanobacteria bacterium P01_D01_bin.36]